jgi:hypothetical protein
MKSFNSFNDLVAGTSGGHSQMSAFNDAWTDRYEGQEWAKKRGIGHCEYETTSPAGQRWTAWIESEGDKHVVQWLRGRGLRNGEDRELKPGKKTVHGTLDKAKAFAEQAVQDEFRRQLTYGS